MESTTHAAQSVQTIMKYTYGLVPIVAGADKFTNLLTDWKHYLAPIVAKLLPVSPSAFMGAVGIIEIVAGVLVLWKPRIGAYVVMAWLLSIAINLLLAGYYDIAVRDIVMAIGAYSLARLTAAVSEKSVRTSGLAMRGKTALS